MTPTLSEIKAVHSQDCLDEVAATTMECADDWARNIGSQAHKHRAALIQMLETARSEALDGGPLTPLEIAAQCWCDPRASHLEMNTVLATVFAERLEGELSKLRARTQPAWC